jgi:hypothetical protein
MRPRFQRALWIVTLFAMATLCRADVPPEIVARGKKATALVAIEGGQGYGTAFCIDSAGFFVTNAHFLIDVGSGKHLTLILDPGEKYQRKLTARVLRQDKNSDLALLQVDKTPGLTALEMGNSEHVTETQVVTAFGYPSSKDPASGTNEYPAIAVSTRHIASLQRSRSVLEEIGMDASLNSGNAGGPVLDASGQVIGIVMDVAPGARISLALPIQRLRAWLNHVDLSLTQASIPLARIHEAQVFTIQVAAFGSSGAGLTIELDLKDGYGAHRTFAAKSEDGHTFTVRAVPVPLSNSPAPLRLQIRDESGTQQISISDRTVKVGGKAYPLSRISRIQQGTVTAVTLVDGQQVAGKVSGLEAVATQIAGSRAVLDLSRAREIAIEKDEAQRPFVDYHLIARQHGSIVRKQDGSLFIEGVPFPFREAEQATQQKTAEMAHQLWVKLNAGSGPLSVSSQRGCDILMPANSSGSGEFLAGYQSKGQLHGDFDIQFSYQLLEWPERNGARIGLEVLNSAGARLATLHRVSLISGQDSADPRESETMTISNSSPEFVRFATSSLKNKLRLTRTGGQFKGYRWNDSTNQWQEIMSGGNDAGNVRFNLIAWSNNGDYNHQQVRIVMYDFIVNKGTWTFP